MKIFPLLFPLSLFCLTSCVSYVSESQIYLSNGRWMLRDTNEPFNGVACSYYKNNSNKSETTYKNGMVQGKSRIWYDNGTPQWEGNKVGDNIDGTATAWYKDGQKSMELEFSNGVPVGKHVRWYADGKMDSEKTYENGVERRNVHWYSNGNKAWDMSFDKNGRSDGEQFVWYENGRLKAHERYKQGKCDGECAYWIEDGTIVARGTYVDGSPWNGTFFVSYGGADGTTRSFNAGTVKTFVEGKELK